LKQFKSGTVSLDVKCKQDLQLITKNEDGSPACVKPETSKILVERGWGTVISLSTSEQNNSLSRSNTIKISNANFTISYNITGAIVKTIISDLPSKSF